VTSPVHPVVAEVHPHGGQVPRRRGIPRQLEQPATLVNADVRHRLGTPEQQPWTIANTIRRAYALRGVEGKTSLATLEREPVRQAGHGVVEPRERPPLDEQYQVLQEDEEQEVGPRLRQTKNKHVCLARSKHFFVAVFGENGLF
jgi:hypothetical protein